MHCTIVTPERTLIDAESSYVVATLEDGEIGIAPGHAPLIGRLGMGEVRVDLPDRKRHFYVEGGFVEVLNDHITVLSSKALPLEEIDLQTVMSALPAPSARVQLRLLRREEKH